MSKSVHTPPSPYYIGVHIHEFCNSKKERKDISILRNFDDKVFLITTQFTKCDRPTN